MLLGGFEFGFFHEGCERFLRLAKEPEASHSGQIIEEQMTNNRHGFSCVCVCQTKSGADVQAGRSRYLIDELLEALGELGSDLSRTLKNESIWLTSRRIRSAVISALHPLMSPLPYYRGSHFYLMQDSVVRQLSSCGLLGFVCEHKNSPFRRCYLFLPPCVF